MSHCAKTGFTTLRDAQTALNEIVKPKYDKYGDRIKRKYKKKDRPQRIYTCDICGLFHLTSIKREY